MMSKTRFTAGILSLRSALRPRLKRFPPLFHILLIVLPAAAFAAADHPAKDENAAPPVAQTPAEEFQIEGFRSARWGMTDAQIKAAIHKDFNIQADKIQTEENPSERTTVLSVTVPELLEGAGKARVSYILGFATKKLIQVNVVWGHPVDPQVKADRIVAAANQLRTLFLTSAYQSDTVASNVATPDGTITVFQGQDGAKHMTLLRLVSTPVPPSPKTAKSEASSPNVALFLSYVLDVRNPDVYRLKKGQF